VWVRGSPSGTTRLVDGAASQAPTPLPAPAPDPPRLRPPSPEDAASVWQLVGGSGALDLNSPYAYLLLCSDFAHTSVVAEAAGRIVGFVGAYRPPPRPDSVFVWQIVTDSEVQRGGLGARLLAALLGRHACRDARFLEATVTGSNEPSRALFAGFARRHGLPLVERTAFGAELFPGEHEAEVLVRIGPLVPRPSHSEEP
jgi:L-2,4-diaminobutyric acid acetyltransferase